MKITALKTVYWNDGSRIRTGKVKQIMRDHAIVDSSGTTYIVAIAVLSLKPVTKVASGDDSIIIRSAKLGD